MTRVYNLKFAGHRSNSYRHTVSLLYTKTRSVLSQLKISINTSRLKHLTVLINPVKQIFENAPRFLATVNAPIHKMIRLRITARDLYTTHILNILGEQYQNSQPIKR